MEITYGPYTRETFEAFERWKAYQAKAAPSDLDRFEYPAIAIIRGIIASALQVR